MSVFSCEPSNNSNLYGKGVNKWIKGLTLFIFGLKNCYLCNVSPTLLTLAGRLLDGVVVVVCD